MLVLLLLVLAGDLHHATLGLDCQLVGGEVLDVQGYAPAVRRGPVLRDPAAELRAERPAVGGRGHRGALDRGGGQGAHVAWSAAGAKPLRPVRRPGRRGDCAGTSCGRGPSWGPAGARRGRGARSGCQALPGNSAWAGVFFFFF
uniref:Secreted protein n=1 Tax=Piliocolobus tephrosceles TaxID=591936 RepID=A0A8C9GM08_9PRIM